MTEQALYGRLEQHVMQKIGPSLKLEYTSDREFGLIDYDRDLAYDFKFPKTPLSASSVTEIEIKAIMNERSDLQRPFHGIRNMKHTLEGLEAIDYELTARGYSGKLEWDQESPVVMVTYHRNTKSEADVKACIDDVLATFFK